MPKDFTEMFKQIPEEQRRLLERMMETGLVSSFGHNDKGWAVIYTPRGKRLLGILKSISAEEPNQRLARIIALDMLAHTEGAFGGFADK